MIVLDTNVVSELMKVTPRDSVVTWLDQWRQSELMITVVAVAELRFGVASCPPGRRRDELTEAVDAVLGEFGDRVLVYDVPAAATYGRLVAERNRAGRPISVGDAQVAAICLSRTVSLATRNMKDFEGVGLTLHNPWD